MLFTEPDLFLVVNRAPQPDDPDWAHVLCENHAENKAISAYRSSVDAMLDAIFVSKPGKRYYAIYAGRFVPTAFIRDHGGMLRLDVHLGWPAHDGRLIARRSGRPAACAMRQEMVVQPEKAHHITCRLDEDTVHACEQLYNSVGLFEVQECFERVARWPQAQCDRAVAAAIRKLPPLAATGTECNQIALFDIEREQWRFAPASVLEVH